ncbi:hypothetical protein EIP86_002893 [Pleurotus ostreatoroseus]|nr:hypothetical protein EIP86_002893 [Pleurotus ostreatoroseus]
MAASSMYPSSPDIMSSINGLLAAKYMAGSAVVTALYDHILTFDEEVAYIWQGEGTILTKAVYLYLRYGAEIPLLYVAYGASGSVPGQRLYICLNVYVFYTLISRLRCLKTHGWSSDATISVVLSS